MSLLTRITSVPRITRMLKTVSLALAVTLTCVLPVACSRAAAPAPPPAREATSPAPAPVATPRNDAPRRDLSQDERAGGHTLTRHIARTDAQLRERLRDEPGISAASTWTDRETAERVIAAALVSQRAKVDEWRGRSGSRPNLALNYRDRGDDPIGRSMGRRASAAVPCHDAVIVLKWRGDDFYVLTSYPEARR